MKPPLPPPRQANGRPFESLDGLLRAAIAVPKSEIDRREQECRKAHPKRSRPRGKKKA
jgi:hypothetical protein